MNHTRIRTCLATLQLLTLPIVSALALAQTPQALPVPEAVPELGALPDQAPVVSFTPLAQQVQGAAAPGPCAGGARGPADGQAAHRFERRPDRTHAL